MKRMGMATLRGLSSRKLRELREPHLIEWHGRPIAVLLTWAQYETARGLPMPDPAPVIPSLPLVGDSAL